MEYLQKIKNSIAPIVSLTDDEFATFYAVFELKYIRKNEFFLEEGSICSYLGFLAKGTLIYYKPEANGNEITTDFAFEGDRMDQCRQDLRTHEHCMQVVENRISSNESTC
jgi:signal-transduction protein with cAMP-binding, CBS, and nucleotidyltransferase domain